ncbi:MAG: hypothetical protein V7L25_05485 [Nostoc sp.]
MSLSDLPRIIERLRNQSYDYFPQNGGTFSSGSFNPGSYTLGVTVA